MEARSEAGMRGMPELKPLLTSTIILQKNIDNDTGNKNNLVSVRQSDFEVFQALAKDIEEGNNNEAKEYTQVGQDDVNWRGAL